MMSFERLSGLFFLAFSLGYGLLAADIEVYALDAYEPFTARTFPLILAAAGTLVALAMLVASVLPAAGAAAEIGAGAGFERPITGRAWRDVALLLAAMCGYGLLITPVGFIAATTGFLGLGFVLLGERRGWVLATLPIATAVLFEALLSGLLGVYIPDPLLSLYGLLS